MTPSLCSGGVGERPALRLLHKGVADQEVAVSHHEGQLLALRNLSHQFHAPALKAALAHVIADPGFKQVAQDEHGISRAVKQVLGKCLKGLGKRLAQVQVRNKIDGLPVRGGPQQARSWQRLQGARRSQLTSVALTMSTSSRGTSSCMPLRPVRTFSMLSTTSMPDTTWPKTA